MNAFALATMLAVLLLLPIGRTAELPWLVGAIAGLVLLATHRREWRAMSALRVLAVLFAAYWLPALLSAIDAVEPRKTWSTVAAALRYAPFALMAIVLVRGRARWFAVAQPIAAALIALWAWDAVMQGITGWSLAGHLDSDRISGVFGDENLKLGPALAVLSPFVLDWLWRRHGRVAFALGWLLLGAAVLLAGARAGWISYAVVSIAMLWRVTGNARRFVLASAIAMVAAATLGAIAYQTSERTAARIDRTLAFARGDAGALDHALAGRVPIFRTATRMALAHPVNGVGVRSFRYAYPDHADAGDPWVSEADAQGRRTGALHPHQIVLEVAAETGAIGVTAWVLAVVFAWRRWRLQSVEARANGAPAALALLAMTFPLNTHFAFYSSFWALLLWWLVAWWLAAWRDDVAPSP